MNKANSPVIKDLLLVGGGHTHVLVLKRFAMQKLAGVRITLVSREAQSPYSGMLPGYIAGHYSFEQTHIDPGPLARAAGARFFHDEVTGLDLENKQVICRHRPNIGYDVLSIDIGSSPQVAMTADISDHVIPVKPIDGFLKNWDDCLARIKASKDKTRIGVVGAGAAGVELILAIQYRLKNELAATAQPEFHLFSEAEDILVGFNPAVRAKFRRVLQQRGIQLHTEHKVREVGGHRLCCENGASFDIDEIFWATSASAQSWPSEAGLDIDEQGFIRVAETLESISHECIFAAGDIAHVINHPRPKSGVFAVRQAPTLFSNLRNKLQHQSLAHFVPQKHFLSLISTGDRYAVATRSNWTMEGHWVWKWKDWIDRRFMNKFIQLPAMNESMPVDIADGLISTEERQAMSDESMRCGGCGGKVSAQILAEVLTQLKQEKQDDVLVGLEQPDDAAVISVAAGKVLVQTVDFFRSFVDDPYVFGKIAANHALGDIFAMGAEAHTALAIVTLPQGREDKLKEELLQMLQGAMQQLNEAGTSLIGGHTGEATELSLGFTINGFIDQDKILRKQGMCPGDRLIITKALGTGSLFAADMRGKASGVNILAALDSMTQSSRAAASCLFEHGASACTDVTGFGLLGHLLEMTKSSTLAVQLQLDSLPRLAGVEETLALGIFSSLYPHNKQFAQAIANNASVIQHRLYPLLFDPQTAGGLLASVAAERADDCLAALRELGYTDAAIIASVCPLTSNEVPVTILTSE